MRDLSGVRALGVAVAVAMGVAAHAQMAPPARTNALSSIEGWGRRDNIWQRGIGDGFRADAQSITLSAGANGGLAIFGSRQAHDLALISLTYGHMLTGVLGEGHWYRGNLEVRAELFTGAQFAPERDWLVGFTPHLRYDFARGHRWVPFLDVGAGVTATGIGPPDLSGTFEFNLQAGGGVNWFLKDNLALTFEAHYLHWSCGGISQPNLGLNGITGMFGVSFFF